MSLGRCKNYEDDVVDRSDVMSLVMATLKVTDRRYVYVARWCAGFDVGLATRGRGFESRLRQCRFFLRYR